MDDEQASELMRQFKRDMNVIAGSVRRFTKEYESCDFTQIDKQKFKASYKEVGAVLEQRLDKEESELCQLYLRNKSGV